MFCTDILDEWLLMRKLLQMFLWQDPVTRNNSKTLCCLCCESGPIQAQVQINRAGYVPGEYIYVNATVDNST